MTTRERLAIAAAASLALHVLVMSSTSIPLPLPPGEPRPLQASLAPLPVLKPAAPRPRVQASRRAAPRPVPPVPVVAAASPIVVPEFEPEADPAEEVAPVPTAPEPPQQLALAAETTTAAAALPHSLPRRGRISYNVLYGNDRHYVGKVVASWEVLDDSYILTSDGETGGLVELFRPQRLRYLSRGRITARGLQPDSFLASRTRRGQNETADARFDWSAGSLTFGSARDRKSAALPAGAQDFMSFIYQFVLLPPAPGRHRVPITTATRFETYDIEVSREQSIETPLGTVRALPVRQLPRAGDESIELWLAAEYRYLPVRIRHFDREGNFSGEQVASEIRISEE